MHTLSALTLSLLSASNHRSEPSIHPCANIHLIDLLQRNHQTMYFNLCNGTHNYCLLTIKSSWDSSDPQQWHQGEISCHCLWHACVLHSSVCERGLSMCRSFLASSFRRIMKDSVVLFLSLSYLLLKDSVSVWAAIHTDIYRKVFAVDWIYQGQLRAETPSDVS